MAALYVHPWPPAPIVTERLVMRAPQASDRDGFISLLTSPLARQFLGGPIAPTDAEAATSAHNGRTPGSFVVRSLAANTFLGTIGLDRRDLERPGHLESDGLELEISYVFGPAHWGHGYATEAVRAVLGWAAATLPDLHVVACTQVANTASIALLQRIGFHEHQRFVEFDAEQSLWRRSLTSQENP